MRDPRLTAVTRFGLGPRPGDIERASGDPVAYVALQCDDIFAADIWSPDLLDIDTVRDAFRANQKATRVARRALNENATDETKAATEAALGMRGAYHRDLRLQEIAARFDKSVTTSAPYVERLALFWSNHFAISLDASLATRYSGPLYEREAIRPHVLGRYTDLLKAAITHPAMLTYLDNNRSIGPNSRFARRSERDVDINENLGRELLELHTLGVDGGYTQDDVIEAAKLLTGWTGGFTLRRRFPVFDRLYHEPGARTILGVTYPAGGEEQLDSLLEDLAVHPATARFLSGKLARHFVGDDASAALIESLATVFLDTGGDLQAVSRALAMSDEAWAGEAVKFVPSYDFMVACGRALSLSGLEGRLIDRSARILAQRVWRAPSPAGWPDDDNAFSGGDAIMERVDFAEMLTRRYGVRDVMALAEATFGDTLDPHVVQTIRRAESSQQALVLFLMSPAFQRR